MPMRVHKSKLLQQPGQRTPSCLHHGLGARNGDGEYQQWALAPIMACVASPCQSGVAAR